MRYVLGLLASLLICSPVHAASVSYSISVLYTSITNPVQLAAVGIDPNAGSLSFDDSLLDLLAPETERLISFADLTDFALRVPLTDLSTGQPSSSFTFGLSDLQVGQCASGGECGIRFLGQSFQGFEGRFGTGATLVGTGNALNFSGDGFDLQNGFDLLAVGRVDLQGGIQAPVPEPSSWAMMGICGLLVAWTVRKRRAV